MEDSGAFSSLNSYDLRKGWFSVEAVLLNSFELMFPCEPGSFPKGKATACCWAGEELVCQEGPHSSENPLEHAAEVP